MLVSIVIAVFVCLPVDITRNESFELVGKVVDEKSQPLEGVVNFRPASAVELEWQGSRTRVTSRTRNGIS